MAEILECRVAPENRSVTLSRIAVIDEIGDLGMRLELAEPVGETGWNKKLLSALRCQLLCYPFSKSHRSRANINSDIKNPPFQCPNNLTLGEWWALEV